MAGADATPRVAMCTKTDSSIYVFSVTSTWRCLTRGMRLRGPVWRRSDYLTGIVSSWYTSNWVTFVAACEFVNSTNSRILPTPFITGSIGAARSENCTGLIRT